MNALFELAKEIITSPAASEAERAKALCIVKGVVRPNVYVDLITKIVEHPATTVQDRLKIVEVVKHLGSQQLLDDVADVFKASPYVTKDQKVDPSHSYSHSEGPKDHARHFYTDQNGNFIRYTNAPSGDKNQTRHFGEPQLHPLEPTLESAPQYFDPTGRKLTRAPGSQAVEWNQSYHPDDPKNFWVGRWVNPSSGEHEYTYLDADVRRHPAMYIHQQLQLTDVRIPVLRQYIQTLSNSPMLKDRIVATALALLDQARFRVQELTALSVGEIQDNQSFYVIGNRMIFPDHKVRVMLSLMTENRTDTEPFLAVPFTKKNGDVDEMLLRRIGPHYLNAVLDQLGLSLEGLQIYHATQAFSREITRLTTQYHAPFNVALEYATLSVASEMGHDVTQEQDMEQILPMIRELLLDPVVVRALEMNAEEMGLNNGMPLLLPLPPPFVAYVSFDVGNLTPDEKEFSTWLHKFPAHTALPEPQAQQPQMPQPIDSGIV